MKVNFLVYKILSLLFSFAAIVILTQLPVAQSGIEFSSKYLVIIPVVSLISTYLFFSDFTVAAENLEIRPHYPVFGYLGFTILLLASVSLVMATSYRDVFYCCVLGAIYMSSLYLDNYIVMVDTVGGRRNLEFYRLLFRVVYAVLVLIVMLSEQSELVSDDIYKLMIGFLLVGAFVLVVLDMKSLDFKKILNINLYKSSLLLGNLFWLLPRFLFNTYGYLSEVLQLAFLQTVGLAVQQFLNMLYGRLISFSRKNKALIIFVTKVIWISTVVGVFVCFFVNEEVRSYFVMCVYAFGTVLQVLSRARSVNRFGNRGASIVYIQSLFLAFPLVSVVVIFTGSSAWTMLSLILILLIRAALYEKGPFFKRYL